MTVVAAGLIFHEDKLLIAQRKADDELGLCWEFPGGKIEAGESPEEALERELLEELDITTRTDNIFDVRYVSRENGDLLILYYYSTYLAGSPKTLDCNDFRWISPTEIAGFDFAPSDWPVAEKLMKSFTGGDQYG